MSAGGMLAVLSDIHGNLPALEAVIADAQAAGATRFVNLGDSLSGPLWPSEAAALLMRLDWPTIAGNHERQLLTDSPERMNASDRFARAALDDAQLAWLAAQPRTLSLDGIRLVHGTARSDVEQLLETVEPTCLRAATDAEIAARLGDDPAMLTLCGHSHLPGVRVLSDGRTAANPGSVGLQAYREDLPFPHAVQTGDPRARYALVRGMQVELRAIAYDHATAAAKAEREGRDDWALALRTGLAPD
ncbi:metallophosphatase family protein [Sphingomonas sp. R647]|uniref:metallophosphoesterase family protein n=1 Tax=Sphingomonas sp. R647 TaxID=2875233 RepID=UPI001CD75E8F|nr:metallophosphoesterase family protein [Sphingomonas sp. R647]MCA1197339.1 metallophosphatase family protein [Sphingomonas sp. R647]